jgi:PAS domain-containing protein
VTTQVRRARSRRMSTRAETITSVDSAFEGSRIGELLAQAPAAIGLLTGPDHRWTYINEEYVRLTGRKSPVEFIGKTLLESLPELESQVFVILLDEVYRTGQPYIGREMKALLNRSARGLSDECYWDFIYQPVRNKTGVMEGILVHAIEVTDKVLTRRRIETSERKFRDLAETARIALHWVGPDGTILWANQAELDLLGYSSEEYIGHNISEFHIDSSVPSLW